MFIQRRANCFQTQIVGIRCAPDGEQDMRSEDLKAVVVAIQFDADAFPNLLKMNTTRIESKRDAFRFEHLLDSCRKLFVLMRDQARPALDDRHLRSEPPIHMRKLKPD